MVKPSEPTPYLTPEQRIDLWREYEKVTMHFNELIIRLRTQAMGGLAAIVALGGLAIKLEITEPPRWWVLFSVSVVLFAAWVSIVIIDLAYYDKLLRGSVDALLKIEKESNGLIYLSTFIEKRFAVRTQGLQTRLSWGRKLFYFPIGLVLLAACVISCLMAWGCSPLPSVPT